MCRDQDRFPLSTLDSSTRAANIDGNGQWDGSDRVLRVDRGGDVEAGSVRPFGLRFVDYSPGRPKFRRPQVSLCPDRQVGIVDDRLASDIMPVAATMTSVESDGQDVLKVDWMKDD